jgi:chitosanase
MKRRIFLTLGMHPRFIIIGVTLVIIGIIAFVFPGWVGMLNTQQPSKPASTPSVSPGSAPDSYNDSLTLLDPHKKEVAMQLLSSAENSSTDWRAQYAYIEDIRDNRGYTAGIVGFTSGTSDMLQLIRYYVQIKPDNNILAKYLPALEAVDGTSSHEGLDPTFVDDWKTAATDDPIFQQAQNHELDAVYFDPSVSQAVSDGLGPLGQFIYFDAIVMHGPGDDANSFGGIRTTAMANAKTPAQGGDETVYLNAFLDARKTAMLREGPATMAVASGSSSDAHSDTSRIDTEQRAFLQQGNLDLNLPLRWSVYGESFSILR